MAQASGGSARHSHSYDCSEAVHNYFLKNLYWARSQLVFGCSLHALENRTPNATNMSIVHFLQLPGSQFSFAEITEYIYFSLIYSLGELQYIKLSNMLYHWLLSMVSFRFCETYLLHIEPFVVNKSVISPFLGGGQEIILLLATNFWYVVKCDLQKGNWSNKINRWNSILVTFIFKLMSLRVKYLYSVKMKRLSGNTINWQSARSRAIFVFFARPFSAFPTPLSHPRTLGIWGSWQPQTLCLLISWFLPPLAEVKH